MAQTAVEWLVNHWKKLQSEGEKMSWQQIIDITELAKQIEREQKENALKIIEAQKKYIEVLCKEIDSAVSIAHIHGWRSNLVEDGESLRNEITRLQNETYGNNKNK